LRCVARVRRAYRLRRSRKNSCKIDRHSSSSMPPVAVSR
jgi:hypothetical protein